MALETTTFITVNDVKAVLDISESTWDSVIESLINQCSRFISNYCGGRTFIVPATDDVEYLDGGKPIFLKNYPIVSVTSISYRSGDYDNPNWTAYNAKTDYIINNKTGEIKLFSKEYGVQNIKIAYKGGYANAAAVPSDLKLAVVQMVSKEFGRRRSQGITSESVGGASISWNLDQDKMLSNILDNYRIFI
jgi:hypothetical protein